MKILVALDLSDYADFVLIKAIKTAKQQNAKMDIMIVAGEQAGETLFQQANKAARLHQQKAIAQGVKAKVRVRSGKSAIEEILKYQRSENIDLIVLGRRSHTDQATSPIGDVANSVVAYATCTVMVVRCMVETDQLDFQ